jgi:hypothetical protein
VRLARRAALLGLALAVAACGSTPAPTGAPTATPAPSPTSAVASGPVSAAAGGTVSLAGGPTLAVAPGGVAADTTATIRAAAADVPAWTGASPATPVGAPWEIDLGGAPLTGAATLTFRADPAALPAGVSTLGLLLTYLDPSTRAWVPVPASVDAAGTVTASVSHMSVWQLFGLALGLPFPEGASVSVGPKGVHADNFGSTTGGPTGVIKFPGDGYKTTPASLDLVATAGGEVRPVAAGVVISAWTDCDLAVVDHGGGLWSVYVHVDVTARVGDKVDPSRPIGYVLPEPPADWAPPSECGNLASSAPHVHLAFARASDATGTKGEYLPIAGAALCGHTVSATGDISGLGTAGGGSFSVPSCAGNAVGPGPAPTPPPVLSGSWVAPVEGATIKAAKVTLSATAASRLPSAKVANVTFYVATGSKAPVKACDASNPDAKGAWSCTVADLWKLGAQLGDLTLSFDVFDDVGDLARSPGGARTVKFAAPAPEPTNVVFGMTAVPNEFQMYKAKVTWAEADVSSTIWIYGVTECTIDPKVTGASEGKPCVAQGMRIPNASMVVIGKVPAAKRSYSWRSPMGAGPFVASLEGDPFHTFYSVVLIARNAAGYTHFVVAATEPAPCAGCAY